MQHESEIQHFSCCTYLSLDSANKYGVSVAQLTKTIANFIIFHRKFASTRVTTQVFKSSFRKCLKCYDFRDKTPSEEKNNLSVPLALGVFMELKAIKDHCKPTVVHHNCN